MPTDRCFSTEDPIPLLHGNESNRVLHFALPYCAGILELLSKAIGIVRFCTPFATRLEVDIRERLTQTVLRGIYNNQRDGETDVG